jgi:hypothetical protein
MLRIILTGVSMITDTRLVINPIFSQLESKVGLPDLPTKSIKYVDLVLK